MAEKDFAVVEFVDGVQLVPKFWLQDDDTCYWPKLNNQSKYYKLVENKELFNSQWEKCNVISILAETDTFKKGLEKLKESEMFTDINTDIDEITGRKKRKKIQKQIISSSSEDWDDDVEMEQFPSPPNQVNNKSDSTVPTHFSSQRSHQSSSKPLRHQAIKTYRGSKSHSSNGSSSQSAQKINQQSGPNQSPNTVSGLLSKSNSNCSLEDFRHSPYRIPLTHSHTSSNNMQSSSTCRSSYVHLHDQSPERNLSYKDSYYGDKTIKELKIVIERSDRFIKRCFAETKIDIQKILQNQENILVRLCALEGRNLASAVHNDHVVSYFPLKKEDDLEDLEGNLLVQEFRSALVEQLRKIGGGNVKETVYNLMKEVFTNDLAARFSWLGLKKKKKLCNLYLSNVLIDIVHLSHTTTNKEIVEHIKAWLRHAPMRCVRESNRNTATRENNIETTTDN